MGIRWITDTKWVGDVFMVSFDHGKTWELAKKPVKENRMTIQEAARCLYKRGWADRREQERALDAVEKMSPEDQRRVVELGFQYRKGS